MGGSSPPPPAPDPAATAAAQSAANKDTAIAQARLNSTNQVTPYGNLTYTAGPEVGGVPQYTATTTLSPTEQGIFDKGEQTKTNLAGLGVSQSQKVSDILNTPFDLNSSIGTQQADISKSLLDPVWQQREQQQRQQLANQGIQQGSEAYTNAMRDFGMQRDNSYNSALLADRGQASQEALTQRNQPINEISALMGGSQVQQPNFVSTPNTGIAPTDVIGATGQALQANQFNYGQKMQQQNALIGGISGLAGTALGGWAMSEPGMKKDKARIGSVNGMGLYSFRYKGEAGSAPKRIGLMADQVQKKMPEAVSRVGRGGPRMVNYTKVAKALTNGR